MSEISSGNRLKYNRDDRVFFTSDTHFGHKNIVKFNPASRNNFDNVKDMDEHLIKNWNEQVGVNDIVYHLGDFALAPSSLIKQVLPQLNGRINLFLGNHDVVKHFAGRDNIESIQHYAEIVVDGTMWCLNHFPIYSWHGMAHGAYHLHGHCHGAKLVGMPKSRFLDVGIDNRTDMKLWTIPEIQARLEPISSRPHNAGYSE